MLVREAGVSAQLRMGRMLSMGKPRWPGSTRSGYCWELPGAAGAQRQSQEDTYFSLSAL